MLRSILSLALIASMATISFAQPPKRDGDRPQRGSGARGNADAAKGKGADRQAGMRPDAMNRRGGPLMQADPEAVAAKMMEQFDKDGDSKLDASELVALLKSLRERAQGQGNGRPGMQRPGMQRAGGDADKRMRGRNGEDSQGALPGGDKPKRPGSEKDA